MSYRCENCQSLFFKTLETRFLAENEAILYKKRCKRCKYKYLVRKDISTSQVHTASYSEWTQGRKIATSTTKVSERAKIFVSEYTGRMSQAADRSIHYLQAIRKTEEQGDHDGQPKTAN